MPVRKIAANYIYLPGFPLVKNGYVVLGGTMVPEVVDTGGRMKEIAGLEFYGGMIVPDYIVEYQACFRPGGEILPLLEQCFAERGNICHRVAILEGADLKTFTWRPGARVRLL